MLIKSKLIAFTLAEVLIVLGIIGVIAAITIPPLINNYQKMQYVAALKKAYAETNIALKQLATDYGCIDDLKCTGLFTSVASSQDLGDAFVKYFKISKNCRDVIGDCFAEKVNKNYDGSGTIMYPNMSAGYDFITVDGMSFHITKQNGFAADCENNYSTGISDINNMSKTCGRVYIDVNGPKAPNCYGKDFFVFYITNNRGALLYPQGGIDDNFQGTNYWWNDSNQNYCSSANKDGTYCTGRIMEEGWQMNY